MPSVAVHGTGSSIEALTTYTYYHIEAYDDNTIDAVLSHVDCSTREEFTYKLANYYWFEC